MKHRSTNKNIITVVLSLALLLVCTASIVSCGGDDSETLFPEYTGDIWTLYPVESGLIEETGHIEADSNDNIIDAGFFTAPVSENDEIGTETNAADETNSFDEETKKNDNNVTDAAETTAHVIGPYDGIHNWPSDEFDHSGYKPLNPVTTAVN